MRLAAFALSTSLVLLSTGWLAAEENWPQFRGPDATGVSIQEGLPLEWDGENNIKWKTPLAGYGASSPVTWGDRIYVTYYNGYGLSPDDPGDETNLKRWLACFERRDGKPVWAADVAAELPEQPYQGFVALHGYTSSTPAVDDGGVYVFFNRTGVAAFSHEGEQRWLTNVGDGLHNFGAGTSPVLYGDLVIVNACVESGSLVALDKATGEVVWEQGDIKRAWSTPVLVDVDGKTELVLSTEGKLLAFDPADGTPLWSCAGIDDYICPTIIAHDGVIYAIGARKNTCIAVKAGGRGDVTESHLIWELDKGSNVSSPVYHEGYLYWASESKGIAYCADAKEGKLIYQERIEPRPDRIYASPVLADGRIYYVSRDKGTYVLPAKPEYELLAHNVIADDDSIFNASPAVSDGDFILRSDKFLYRIGK